MYIEKKDDKGNETELYKKYKGKAEINVAKQRMGPVGRVPLVFIAETTTFKNYHN
jgi:replicative DNA helicase